MTRDIDPGHPPALAIAAPEKLLLSRREAAALCGVSLGTFDGLVREGKIPRPRVSVPGGTQRWHWLDLMEWR